MTDLTSRHKISFFPPSGGITQNIGSVKAKYAELVQDFPLTNDK